MNSMVPRPHGIDEIMRVYGVPGRLQDGRFVADSDWAQQCLRRFPLTFPLRQSWDQRELRSFLAHVLVGAEMVEALEEIHAYYGLAYMRRHMLDQWGGVYNPRLKRGGQEPSTHAYAISIDYLPELGPMGGPSRIPWPVREAFLRRGFINLDHDTMHYQACDGY